VLTIHFHQSYVSTRTHPDTRTTRVPHTTISVEHVAVIILLIDFPPNAWPARK
jgi:hypothetical protein